MIRLALALLLLLVAAVAAPGEASAHAGAHDQAASEAGWSAQAAELPPPAAPAGHQHGERCCAGMVGCFGSGSLAAGAPPLPVPASCAAAAPMAAAIRLSGRAPPLPDRPPRPV